MTAGGFAFNFGPPAGGAATAPPPSSTPAQGASKDAAKAAEDLRLQMMVAFGQGGNVDLFEKSQYEKPGTYLERIEEVKFVVSQNKGKGTAGQSFVICKRKIIRTLWHDPNLGAPDVVGNTTATRYKLALDPAYRSCVQFMAKVCDIHHKTLTRENMVEICMPSQMFAGVCVVTSRYFLPVDPAKPKEPFLTCYYKGRVDADELMSGNVPEMGGPLTPAEIQRFWGGQPPVDPFWVTVSKAENWARTQNHTLPTDDQRAQMTGEQMSAYFEQIVAAYQQAKAAHKAATAGPPQGAPAPTTTS